MYDFISNFVNNHPWIVSIIGAIIIYLCIAAAIGLIYFLQWLYGISKIASAIVILFPALVIFVRAMISS